MASATGYFHPADDYVGPGIFSSIGTVLALQVYTYTPDGGNTYRFGVSAFGANPNASVSVADFDTEAEAITYATNDPDALL